MSYYLEMMFLVSKGMPPPAHWSLEDWRIGTRIAQEHERLVNEDALSERE